MTLDLLIDELARLRSNGKSDKRKLVGPTQIHARATRVSAEVIVQRVRTVLETTVDAVIAGRADPGQIESRYPQWFRTALQEDPDWDLESWLIWFSPEQRSWYWWSGKASERESLVIEVLSEGLPFSWGALDWLLTAAGAEDVRIDLWT